MIHVVTGLGPDGRSTILSKEEKVLASSTEGGLVDDSKVKADHAASRVFVMGRTHGSPPELDFARLRTEPLLDVPIAPGEVLWLHLSFGPVDYDFHRTDTLDWGLILAGEVELVLEDASVTLGAGDSVVIPGVKHQWRSDTGWEQAIMLIGLGEPA